MSDSLNTWIYTAGFLVSVLAASATHALDKEALESALQAPQREVSDRIRDEARKPVEVLDFLGLEAGMKALDVYAAGGYFTYIISKAVGENGVVYAQTPPSDQTYQDNRTEMTQAQALDIKIAAGNLHNVIKLPQRMSNLELTANSLDFILLSQILHDYHNGSPARAQRLLQQLYDLLKPGGIVGVIDHVGLEGLDNRRMHRMQKSEAVSDFEAVGFIVEAESDLLHNPRDNYRRSIFDPILNRSTDQFLFRLRKPSTN